MAAKIEGLPIQKEWMVVGVREGDEEPGQKGGTLKKFYVDFEGAPDVYWRRKMPATVEVGKTYFGTISEGQHGPLFKKETPGGAPTGGGSTASSGGGRSYKPESEFDPEKVARMGYAHAQDMALMVLTKRDALKGEEAEVKGEISKWADWFAAEVDSAGNAAKGAAAAAQPPPSSPPPTQASTSTEPQPQSEETILKTCVDAGLSSYPAGKLTQFICGRLSPDQQRRARVGLADFETQGDTLEKLKTAYTEAMGEPLPESDPEEDDIPF
jgi:hypothetical protein